MTVSPTNGISLADGDNTYINETGDETITGSLTIDNLVIDGNDISASSGNITLNTNDVIVDTSSNVGIGTSPSYRLDVAGGSQTLAHLNSSAAGVYMRLQDSTNSGVYIGQSAGDILLQTTSATRVRVTTTGSVFMYNLKSGATAAAAGAGAGELWVTASHATLPDGVVMQG